MQNEASTFPQSEIGLACAGGVVEGAIYEIGALCALEAAIEGLNLNDLGAYVGISSGALLTSCLANGISAKTLSKALIGQAEEPEMNFTPATLFNFAFNEYVERLSHLPNAVWKSVDYFLRRPAEWSFWGSLGGFSAMIPTGLFSNAALEQYLRRMFAKQGRTNDFRKLKNKLRIVATDLDAAAVTSFGESGWDHVPISKAVQASTALPGLYTPVEIDNRTYIDGVAQRTVNATAALKEGVKLLFCINPIVPVNTRSPQNETTNRQLTDYGLPAVMSQTLRVMVFSRMQTGFERYKHLYPEVDTLLIEPEMDDFEMFFSNIFSFSNRHKVCEHAYRTTFQYLAMHETEIEAKLQKHGLRLRKESLRQPPPLFKPEELKPKSFIFEATETAFTKLDQILEDLRQRVAA